MVYRTLLLLSLFFTQQVLAAQCLDVFPDELSGNHLNGAVLINVPNNTSTEVLVSGTTVLRGDNFFGSSFLGNKGVVYVGPQTPTQKTARVFINSSVSWQNVEINEDGDPEDLIIYVAGSLQITGGQTEINAIIYVKGAVTINGNIEFEGAITAEGAVVNHGGDLEYEQDAIENADFNGMCGQAPVITEKLLAFYRFEQNDFGSGIIDSSGEDNHGVLLGGFSTSSGRYCRGFATRDFLTLGTSENNTSVTANALRSNLDVDQDIGKKGSISFWYRSETNWNTGGYNGTGERTLFDASKSSSGKYFTFEILNNGRLIFSFEDSQDRDREVITPSSMPLGQAGQWYYLTATWDYDSNRFEIYVDGQLQVGQTKNTNGTPGDFTQLVFGDNASTYGQNNHHDLASFTSANGTFDEIKIYNYVINANQIAQDMATSFGCTQVNHYEIIHDGNGLTCEPEIITIKACTNAVGSSCQQSTNSVTLDLIATGVSETISQPLTFTGTGTVSLPYVHPETVVLSVANPSITPTAPSICNNNAPGDCNLTFADAGFRFIYGAGNAANIANQTAGLPFADVVKLQAVDNNNGVCTALFSGNVDVDLALESVNPGTISPLSFSLSGTAIAKNAVGNINSYSNISLFFDGSGMATLPTPMYQDAGQIKLHARYEQGGISLLGNSNAFWLQPALLQVKALSAAGVINGNSRTSPVIHKAGQDFTLEVTAVNGETPAQVTPGYQPGQIQFSLARTGPTSVGQNGLLTYANIGGSAQSLAAALTPVFTNVTLMPFVQGVSSFTSSQYSEVGLLNLVVRDNNYGDEALTVLANAIDIGRFVPDHLQQTVQVDLGLSINDHGSFDSTCPTAPTFAYIGQLDSTGLYGTIYYELAPKMTITAYNAQNQITENYGWDVQGGVDDFVRLKSSGVTITPPTSDPANFGSDGAKMALVSHINNGDLLLVSGGVLKYQLSSSDRFYYPRLANTKVDEFDSVIVFTESNISIVDSDGVMATSTETIKPQGIKIRYGRLNIDNSFGPETENLPQPLSTEYLKNGKFVLSDNDNCTSYDASKLQINDIGSLSPALSGVLGGAFPFFFDSGKTEALMLKAPGAGNVGEYGVSYQAPSWLMFDWNNSGSDQNPSAVASFGRYRNNDRIIYWREVNQ